MELKLVSTKYDRNRNRIKIMEMKYHCMVDNVLKITVESRYYMPNFLRHKLKRLVYRSETVEVTFFACW